MPYVYLLQQSSHAVPLPCYVYDVLAKHIGAFAAFLLFKTLKRNANIDFHISSLNESILFQYSFGILKTIITNDLLRATETNLLIT